MSEYLFILGAGASAHAEVPMMAGFLDRARQLYSPHLQAPWKEHFDRVFEILIELQKVHSKAELDLNNIEAVFTTFELGQTIRKLPGADDDFDGAVNSLKALITFTVEQSLRFTLDVKTRNLRATQDYEEFAKFVKDFNFKLNRETGSGGIGILTFNYDVGLDVALFLQGIDCDYCLDAQDTGVDAIKLLKLHGSVNWRRRKDSDAITYYPVKDYCSEYHTKSLDRNETSLALPCTKIAPLSKLKVEVEETPVIVPPGLFKNEYQSSISQVWEQAARELEEAEEIIVIGYSLPPTDFFFRNLFALGTVGRKFIRRFAVVNPDKSGRTEERFKSLLGPGTRERFDYLKYSFAEIIPDLRAWYKVPPAPPVIKVTEI